MEKYIQDWFMDKSVDKRIELSNQYYPEYSEDNTDLNDEEIVHIYNMEHKEETLEEAAIKHGKTATSVGTSNILSFEMGASWQKERDNKLIDELIGLAKIVIFQNQNYQPGTVSHRRYKQAKKLIEKAKKQTSTLTNKK